MKDHLTKVKIVKQSGISELDSILLPHDAISIDIYSTVIFINKVKKGKKIKKKRGYLIEIHNFEGFSMIKYYPKSIQNSKNKYKLRGQDKALGFSLKTNHIKHLFHCCGYLMKDYLDKNPNNFIGYIGQPDKYDDESKVNKLTATRARVYRIYVNSIFRQENYKVSSDEVFEEINLKVITKSLKIDGSLNEKQSQNYKRFIKSLTSCGDELLNFMTAETRRRILASN